MNIKWASKSEKNEIFSFDEQSENENFCGGDGKKPIYYIRMSNENGVEKSGKSRPVLKSFGICNHQKMFWSFKIYNTQNR